MRRTAYLPQLVFSTRARHPRGGADFVREIVAATPGVDEAVRGDFYRRADIVGRVLQTELGEPIYTFSPVAGDGGARWLFARTVPIGAYRKGHQLLTHGLLVERWHLEALAGDPFFLERERGLRFRDDHPGAQVELPLLRVELPAVPPARDAEARRLERLSGELAERDRVLPALLDGLARGGPVLYVTPAPRPALVEWLLLHLHPDDRPEVSFHTWYGHGREVPYRLLLVPPEDLREVRPQFRSATVVEEGRAEPASPTGFGELALALRLDSARRYVEALRRYRVTHLAEGGEHPPLEPRDAVLPFKEALGMPLTEQEQRRLRQLRARGEVEDPWSEAVGLIADAWQYERESFSDRLREAASAVPPLPPEALRRATEGAAADLPARRWALLALLVADPPRGPLTTDRGRREAWGRLAAGKEADRLLAFLSDDPSRRLEPRAVPILAAYALTAARSDRPEERAALAPVVSVLIDALQVWPEPPEPEGDELAASMLALTSEALAWRRRRGLALPRADRLAPWLGVVVPRLGAGSAPAAGELLGACCAAGAVNLAASVIAHLRGAAGQGGEALLAVALAAAARRLAAPLAAAPAGDGALPLLAGLALLLDAVGSAELPAGQALAQNAALATACLPALAGVHAAEDLAALGLPIPSRPLAAIRGCWLRLLARAYHGGAAAEVFADRRWLDLLEDDLRRHPAAEGSPGAESAAETPVHDTRRPVLLHLAWGHWGAATTDPAGSGAPRPATGRLLRLARGKVAAHRQAFLAVLSEDLHGQAEELLSPFLSVGSATADAWSPE